MQLCKLKYLGCFLYHFLVSVFLRIFDIFHHLVNSFLDIAVCVFLFYAGKFLRHDAHDYHNDDKLPERERDICSHLRFEARNAWPVLSEAFANIM